MVKSMYSCHSRLLTLFKTSISIWSHSTANRIAALGVVVKVSPLCVWERRNHYTHTSPLKCNDIPIVNFGWQLTLTFCVYVRLFCSVFLKSFFLFNYRSSLRLSSVCSSAQILSQHLTKKPANSSLSTTTTIPVVHV